MNYKFTLNYVAKPKILINVFDDTITSDSGITESGAMELIQTKVLERSDDLVCEFTKQHVVNVIKLQLPRSNHLSKDDSLEVMSSNVTIDWSSGLFKIDGEIEFTSDYKYNVEEYSAFLFADTFTSMLNRNDFYIDVTPITNLEYEFDFEIAIEVNESDVAINVALESVNEYEGG